MQKLFRLALTALLATSLAACSLVYQPVKTQGLELQQSQVQQLKVGFSQEQVLYVLGSPTSYDSSAHPVWYYVSRVLDSRGRATQKTFFVKFVNGKVSEFGYQEPQAKK